MPRIYVYDERKSEVLSMWVPNLEKVWSEDLERLGRHAKARNRRKTYEVKDENWTLRNPDADIEVSLTVGGDLW